MPWHLISWSETGTNFLTDDSDSDSFDDEVPLEDLMNATNISALTSKKTLAGSSRPLTGEQNESFLDNENAGNEASCSISTVTNNPSSFYFKKIKQKALKIWYVVWQIELFNEQFYEDTESSW